MTIHVWFLFALIGKLAIAQPTSPAYPASSPPISKLPSSPTIVAPSYWPHPAPIAPMDATEAPLGAAPESLTPTAPTSTPSYSSASIPSGTASLSPIPPSFSTHPQTFAPIALTASPISVTFPTSSPNLRPSFNPAEEEPPSVAPYSQPPIWYSRSSDALSATPSSAPKDDPKEEGTTFIGSTNAEGVISNSVVIAGGATTDVALKGQIAESKKYHGPVSFRIGYTARFDKDGKFEKFPKSECNLGMRCFTYDRKVVKGGDSFPKIPMTTATVGKDGKLESFTCEGGPWFPPKHPNANQFEKSELKASFDLTKEKFEFQTWQYVVKVNGCTTNYPSKGDLLGYSNYCKP